MRRKSIMHTAHPHNLNKKVLFRERYCEFPNTCHVRSYIYRWTKKPSAAAFEMIGRARNEVSTFWADFFPSLSLSWPSARTHASFNIERRRVWPQGILIIIICGSDQRRGSRVALLYIKINTYKRGSIYLHVNRVSERADSMPLYINSYVTY